MLSHYQTDFTGYVRKDGCLFFSMLAWVCKISNIDFDSMDIVSLINALQKTPTYYNADLPALGDENSPHSPGIFVFDHEKVFNAAFLQAGSLIRVRYQGCRYMPWEEARGKKGFGVRAGNILIFQVKTESGNGHFQTLFYNPWKPAPEVMDLKSIRYYQTYGG
jgi:hypothetical protein